MNIPVSAERLERQFLTNADQYVFRENSMSQKDLGLKRGELDSLSHWV